MTPLDKHSDILYMWDYDRGVLVKWVCTLSVVFFLLIAPAVFASSLITPRLYQQDADVDDGGGEVNPISFNLGQRSGYVAEQSTADPIEWNVPYNNISSITFKVTWSDELTSEPDNIGQRIEGPDGIERSTGTTTEGENSLELTQAEFQQMLNLTTTKWTMKVRAGECGDYKRSIAGKRTDEGNAFNVQVTGYYFPAAKP